MEVETYLREETWELLLLVAADTIEEWLSPDELAQFDRTLGEQPEGGDDRGLVIYRLFTQKYFSAEQSLFADRYCKDPSSADGSPWPAPEPVPEGTIVALIEEMMAVPPTSPRAYIAGQLLVIAACIQVANETDPPTE